MNTRITSRSFLVVAVAVTAVLLVSASLNAAVVGHWALDDPVGTSGTGSVVESQHARNGITAGTVTFGGAGANAATGTSASFSNSAVHVPFNPDLNTASFTAMAWLYPTGGSGHRSPFTSRYDGGGGQGYILYINPDNQWDFWSGNGPTAGSWHGLTGGAVAFNNWSHVAISFDAATSTKSIFVNGAPANSAVGPNYTPNTLRDLHVGGGGDAGNQYYFPGAVDDFVLFDTALDQAAIQDVMANSVPDPDVLSAGKSYAYGQNLPGYNGGTQYYADMPHVQTLGAYDTGDVTDGAYYPDGTAPAVEPNELLGWGTPVTIPADITIDLESLHAITGVTVGSHTWGASANGSPNDVTLSFSTDGVTFGSPITQSFFDPATDGHNDFVVNVPGTEARYVKLSFDGGALGPNANPNKWIIDEVTVHGSVPDVAGEIPEPATMALSAIALAGLGGYIRKRRKA